MDWFSQERGHPARVSGGFMPEYGLHLTNSSDSLETLAGCLRSGICRIVTLFQAFQRLTKQAKNCIQYAISDTAFIEILNSLHHCLVEKETPIK